MRYTDDDLLTELPRLLRYEPDTGRLIWRPRPLSYFATQRSCATWNKRFADKPALNTLRDDGYRGGCILSRPMLAHVVAFALQQGRWPVGDIDHEDHDGSNNRANNLRETTHQDNGRNMRRSSVNTSGATGVAGFRGRWQAYITVDGRKLHLGTFDDFSEALAARQTADAAWGFHPNHGALAA